MYLGIMGLIFILLFWSAIRVEKMNQRRERDPVYDAKITKRMNKVDPYYNFLFNLFGWILAVVVIYFIYLG
jgi:uncharacterized membrane protein YbhN (UPF0104 family)